MTNQNLIDQLKITRNNLVELAKPLSEEQLNKIPEGYNNNILWNLGHLVVTQQLLHYGLAKLPMHISEPMIADFRKGSSPKQWQTAYSVDNILSLLVEMPDILQSDFDNQIFGARDPYMTSANVPLNTFEEALAYNHFHEGVHLGSVLALKKLI